MTSTIPKVSAVITAYNRQETIVAALESCLVQTFPLYEIIVVDDASTDDTRIILEKYRDRGIKLIFLPNNSGQCVACNAGILAATGDLVALLDSDDLWREDKIEKQIATWIGSADPEHTVIYSRLASVNPQGDFLVEPPRALEHGRPVSDYLIIQGGRMQTSTLLVPRKLAAEVLYDERTRRHTDYGFVMRLEAAGARFLMVEDCLVDWRQAAARNRVSSATDYKRSSEWLYHHRKYMTPRSIAAFQLMTLSRGQLTRRTLEVFYYFIAACAHGVLPVRRIAKGISKRLNLN